MLQIMDFLKTQMDSKTYELVEYAVAKSANKLEQQYRENIEAIFDDIISFIPPVMETVWDPDTDKCVLRSSKTKEELDTSEYNSKFFTFMHSASGREGYFTREDVITKLHRAIL